jgi:hypothetical protein
LKTHHPKYGCISGDTILRWTCEQKTAGEKWVQVFQHFRQQNVVYGEVLKIVPFALALPGTNSPVECIFFIDE